jgi:hypothetical protein
MRLAFCVVFLARATACFATITFSQFQNKFQIVMTETGVSVFSKHRLFAGKTAGFCQNCAN